MIIFECNRTACCFSDISLKFDLLITVEISQLILFCIVLIDIDLY